MNDKYYHPDLANILYGSYIRYDRLYEMTKYAFYGKTDSNDVNIYIDAYSILKSIYTHGLNIQINDSYVIASCLINLAIHLRSYFDTRHHVNTKIYIVYGGARPKESIINYYKYNEKNIFMEESNSFIKNLIIDNLNIMQILCPYLYDIFCIVDYENEFSVITSYIINNSDNKNPNIVYTKELLSYQLVAYEPMTFLYRPKKNLSNDVDNSWVVTKSTIYNAYRYGELKIQKQFDTSLSFKLFSLYQSIIGVRTRSINSLKSANNAIRFLERCINNNLLYNDTNSISMIILGENCMLEKAFADAKLNYANVISRLAAIDLEYQVSLFNTSIISKQEIANSIINLYNPQEIRNINDKYFTQYPLDLNRV